MAHVQRRGERWQARYRGPDGKERSRRFDRKVDAERWVATETADVARGSWIDPAAGKMTLGTFADRWLATVAHLRPSTRSRYGSLCKHMGALAELPLAAVHPLAIQGRLSAMLAAGLSETTVRHFYVLLSEILRAAQRDGRIARNPAADVRPPRRRHREQRFLSAAQVWTLAEAIDPRYRALVLLGAYGGLRWGELAGLRVSRVRVLERRIDVVETLVEIGAELSVGPPKTGNRTVRIPAPLAEELAAHLAAYPPGPNGLVFTGHRGNKPLRHANFYRRDWKDGLAAAKLDPKLRVHDLRHTAVALAVATGAHPKAIQELCGHASITTTLNTYGHLFESLQDSLAERLGETLARSRADNPRTGGGQTAEVVPLRPVEKAL
jgi:integrase